MDCRVLGQEASVPDVKYPQDDKDPKGAGEALIRYDRLGQTAKQAANETIESTLDDSMDLEGYLTWLAVNALIHNGGMN